MKQDQHKLLVDLLKKEQDRKLKLSENLTKYQTVIDKYPDPKYKTPLVLGPGRYDWESAKDIHRSNNSNKNVPMFALQDSTDYRSLDSLKSQTIHENSNSIVNNPYMSMQINLYPSVSLKSSLLKPKPHKPSSRLNNSLVYNSQFNH